MVKYFVNFDRNFQNFGLLTAFLGSLLTVNMIFGLSTYTKNIPEFLYQNFWVLRYNFPKLYQNPKLFQEHSLSVRATALRRETTGL